MPFYNVFVIKSFNVFHVFFLTVYIARTKNPKHVGPMS